MKFDDHLLIETNVVDDSKFRSLARYVAKQLDSIFPLESFEIDVEKIVFILPAVIDRLKPILRAVHSFHTQTFEYYNSLQYTTFLYLLANEQWKIGSDRSLSERLFCLNRTLNSIDLFYSVEMPEVFFISHGIGTVLGNAQYGNRLVIFQNVTVGRIGEMRPIIGNNVVLYPGAVITGRTVVGNNSVVSAGTILHNVVVPDNTVAKFENGELVFKMNTKNYSDLYFEEVRE